MKRGQRKKHKIGTYKINKILCFDDKIFILGDVIHTLAYFYEDFKKKKRFSQMIIDRKKSHK